MKITLRSNGGKFQGLVPTPTVSVLGAPNDLVATAKVVIVLSFFSV